MRSTKRNLVFIVGGGLLAALVILAIVLYPRAQERWTAPLGPGLGLPTRTPASAAASPTQELGTPVAQASRTEADEEPTQAADSVVDNLATEIPVPTTAPEPLCGGPPAMTVLALGIDGADNYLYGLSDVIRVVRVDFVAPKVTVLDLPRDLWVEIPEIEEAYGITHGKLNQAYFYGTPGMGYYEGPGQGAGLLARTLDLNFGLPVDHYGAVNMLTFVRLVDAVGGIDIYLPTDMDGTPVDDKTEDMGYFYAGQQHFNGDQALRFSRIRKRYNVFTRTSNQNMVLCALKEKITSPAVVPRIPQIIAAFQDSILTDLSPEQLTQLACLAPKLTSENLVFTSISEDLLTPGRVYSPQQKAETFIWEADYDVIRDIINQFLAGELESESDGATCP
ncbi:MAG: LCP family protein [Chloroflexota bacterium]|nr:MAG: LCP family protein [Chloroflexota bacterium]